jgi:hypothetical protein
MTLEEFYQLEQVFQASGQSKKEYLISKGINLYTYLGQLHSNWPNFYKNHTNLYNYLKELG